MNLKTKANGKDMKEDILIEFIEKIKYAAWLSKAGIRVDDKLLQAIKDFETNKKK